MCLDGWQSADCQPNQNRQRHLHSVDSVHQDAANVTKRTFDPATWDPCKERDWIGYQGLSSSVELLEDLGPLSSKLQAKVAIHQPSLLPVTLLPHRAQVDQPQHCVVVASDAWPRFKATTQTLMQTLSWFHDLLAVLAAT